MKQNKLYVKDLTVSLVQINEQDFISLTDIARSKNPNEPKDVVKNWLRSKNTIEFLGLWESINNENFKGVEFDSFKNEAGSNSFTLSPTKCMESMNAELIRKDVPQAQRLEILNTMAINQLNSISKSKHIQLEKK